MGLRVGQFAAPTVQWGIPTDIVKPPDNDRGPLYDPALGSLGNLSQSDLQDLQGRIDDLYALLRGERQYFPNG